MIKQKNSSIQYWSFILTVGFIIGCGSGVDPKEIEFINDLVPASGKVTLKGKPLAKAIVIFTPVSEATGGRTATGTTNDKGVFTLHTIVPSKTSEETTGALPGEYKVLISKIVKPDGTPVPEGTTDADAMAEGAKESVPTRYSNEDQSKLKVTITKISSELNFDLK